MRTNNRVRRLPRPVQLLEVLLALLSLAALALLLLIAVALMSGCAPGGRTPQPDAGSYDSLLCWNHRPPPCPAPPDGAPPVVDATPPVCTGGVEGDPVPCLCPTSGETCTTASQAGMCAAVGACFLPDGPMPVIGHLARLPDGSYVCVPGGSQPCIFP